MVQAHSNRRARCQGSILLVILASLPLASLSCGQATQVTYQVSPHPSESGRLLVDMQITGVPRDSLVLSAYASAELLDIRDVQAFGPRGVLRTRVETRPLQSRDVSAPRIVVPGPLASTIRVRYSVAPGKREGNSHTGFTGNSFGEVVPGAAFFSGRQVFLVPEPAEGLRRAVVEVRPSPGMDVATLWKQKGSRWLPGNGGRYVAEDLISSPIAFGAFRDRALIVGKTRYRFSFDSRIAPNDERIAMERYARVVRYLHGLFRRDLGTSYRTIVVPITGSGDDLTGDGWADGQGGTLVPATTLRVHRFAERLLDAYLVHAPYRSTANQPSEYWLVDGVRRLYAWRSVAAAGLMAQEDVNRDVIRAYIMALQTRGMSRDLEAIYARGGTETAARDYVTPAVLVSLERAVRGASSQEGLDAVVTRIYGGRSARSLWNVLPGSPSPAWDLFRKKQVRGGSSFGPEDVPALAPTHATPDPPAGAPVRHIRIAYTGDSKGFLENCGCKVNQSGGVARRATALRRIRSEDPSTVLVDAGNSLLLWRPGEEIGYLSEREQGLYLRTMDLMRYDAAALGVNELVLGRKRFGEMALGTKTPFLTANVADAEGPLAPPARVIHRAGFRIGVIGIFDRPRGRFANPRFDDAAEALRFGDPVVSALHLADSLAAVTDLVVVLGEIHPATIRRLAASSSSIDVVVSSSFDAPRVVPAAKGPSLDSSDEPGFLGRMLVLYTTPRQYGLSVARVDLDAQGEIAGAAIEDVRLNEEIPDDPQVRHTLNAFYDRIGAEGAAQRSVRTPFAWDAARQMGRYVGASACKECHELEHAQWIGTAHAAAFKTLLDRHRHYQPECISCHVVGYGTPHGYRVGDSEEPLGNVQCEVCHGPGADHVADPTPSNIQKSVPERICLECHTPDHSDSFVYGEKLPRVRHDHLN
jgi:cytochrome c554/c'-like protein